MEKQKSPKESPVAPCLLTRLASGGLWTYTDTRFSKSTAPTRFRPRTLPCSLVFLLCGPAADVRRYFTTRISSQHMVELMEFVHAMECYKRCGTVSSVNSSTNRQACRKIAKAKRRLLIPTSNHRGFLLSNLTYLLLLYLQILTQPACTIVFGKSYLPSCRFS